MRTTTPTILLSALWAVTLFGAQEPQTPFGEDKPLALTQNEITQRSAALQRCWLELARIIDEKKENPFTTVAQSAAYKNYRKKIIAVDSTASAARWGLAVAALKAGYDKTAPYAEGALQQYAPDAAAAVERYLEKVPESLSTPQAFWVAAACVGIAAGARTAYNALREPRALDLATQEIVTDIYLGETARLEMYQLALEGGWDMEGLLEDSKDALHKDLETLHQRCQALETSVGELTASNGQSASESVSTFAQQSTQLNALLTEINALVHFHANFKKVSKDPEIPAATETPREVEKRNRKKLGGIAAAFGLGALHKQSGASTRSNGNFTMNPVSILALGCGATMGLADYAHKTITTNYHQALRAQLRNGAETSLQGTKKGLKSFYLDMMAQDDVDTQQLTIQVSGLDAAMQESCALLEKMKALQLTGQDPLNPSAQQHEEIIKTAQSIITKLNHKKKLVSSTAATQAE